MMILAILIPVLSAAVLFVVNCICSIPKFILLEWNRRRFRRPAPEQNESCGLIAHPDTKNAIVNEAELEECWRQIKQNVAFEEEKARASLSENQSEIPWTEYEFCHGDTDDDDDNDDSMSSCKN